MTTTERETAYSSDTTLGDLNRRDRDNFSHIIKMQQAKAYRFDSVIDAQRFMGIAFDSILRRLGVSITPGMSPIEINENLFRRGVKVEHRTYGADEPVYQTGVFVYKGAEIAGYVSSPYRLFAKKSEPLPGVMIKTTAKIEVA